MRCADSTRAGAAAVSGGTPFELDLERVERSRTFYIDTPQGRSRRYRLDVLPVPLFETVSVQYAYPSYTHWPATEGPLAAQGLRPWRRRR